jgi:prolyl 4-hydroxylase
MKFDHRLIDWVVENRAAGLTCETLIETLVVQSGYYHRVAEAIVAAACGGAQEPMLAAGRRTLPDFKLPELLSPAHNHVLVEGREVPVALELFHPRLYYFKGFASAEYVKDTLEFASTLETSVRYSQGAVSLRNVDISTTAPGLRLIRQLASVFDWDPQAFEMVDLKRYSVGDAFNPHFDFHNDANPKHRAELEGRGWNRRLATFVLYLKEASSGGGTYFPNAGLRLQPQAGDAVFFSYSPAELDASSTLHAGEAVVEGEKVVLTATFIQRPRDFA